MMNLDQLHLDHDFARLPHAQRERLHAWRIAMARIAPGTPVSTPGGVIDQLAAMLGMASGTVKTRFFNYRRHQDWRYLIDGRSLPATTFEEGGARCERFKAWVIKQYESNQRSLRETTKHILRLFAHGGEVIPGFEGRAASKVLPPGVSASSLGRVLKPYRQEIERKRQGLKQASKTMLAVRTTRKGMLPGQMYLFDDMWHDNLVLVGAEAVRILEFGALDFASGCRFHWGHTPRVLKDEGKRQGLTQKMFVMFLAYVLRYVGYHRDGVVLMMEKGTATLPDGMAEMLETSGMGISIREGGLTGMKQKMIGGYAGRIGGNPQAKGRIESQHKDIHNVLGYVPGQTGKDRQHIQEQTYGMIETQKLVEAWRTRLLELGKPDMAAALENHFLTHAQFTELLQIKYKLWNARTDHELEGWEGHTCIEYQVAPGTWSSVAELTDGGKYPLSPLLVDSARCNPGLVRERRMSPAEVWASRPDEMRRIPLWLYVDMLKSEQHFGKRLTVHGQLLTVQDKYIGPDKIHYLAEVHTDDGRVDRLRNGEQVYCVANPFDASGLIVLDEAGRIRGVAPHYTAVSPLDEEALYKRIGKVDARNAADMQLQRARWEGETDRVARLNEHNRAIAEEGGVYGRRPKKSALTPAQKGMATRLANSVGDEIDVLDLPEASAPQPVPELPDDPDIDISDIF